MYININITNIRSITNITNITCCDTYIVKPPFFMAKIPNKKETLPRADLQLLKGLQPRTYRTHLLPSARKNWMSQFVINSWLNTCLSFWMLQNNAPHHIQVCHTLW